MAYTETEYSYFYIVFTALPQLSIWTGGQEIAMEEIPVRVEMGDYHTEPLISTARIHLRGASTLLQDKKGYKIEFTRQRYGGESKVALEAPGFGVVDEIALLPCAGDETRIRDKLGWDLYAELAKDEESFGARKAEYVEVFIDNAYMGLYLMIEPIDVEAELMLSGNRCLTTDSVYRTATLSLARDRQSLPNPLCREMGYELYYSPTQNEVFAALDGYFELMLQEDNVAFSEEALASIDMDTMLRHVILIQAGGMTDNVFNNMFVWAHVENGKTVYRFSCWDMDWSWGWKREEIGEEYEDWLYFPMADRMLNLNVGDIRKKLYDKWTELRMSVLDEQRMEERIAQYSALLRESGALAREEERWGFEASDGYEIVVFASMRWPMLDETIAYMAEHVEEEMPFLSSSVYDGGKGDSML